MWNELGDMHTLWGLHLFCTFAMTGVIWFVQLVQYPCFESVRGERFLDFHSSHMRRTTPLVLILMGLELVTAIALVPRGLVFQWNLGLCVMVWLSTFFIQVPLHQALVKGHDSAIIRKLIRGNWIRTSLWSARALILMRLLLERK